jgi:hypothetical protein
MNPLWLVERYSDEFATGPIISILLFASMKDIGLIKSGYMMDAFSSLGNSNELEKASPHPI